MTATIASNATTTPAAGEDTAPRISFIAPPALLIIDIARNTPAAPVTIFPKITKPGPMAAAIATHRMICTRWDSSILLKVSRRLVAFSMNGIKAFATVPPIVYCKTSNDDLSFSTAPPGPDSNASAIDFAAPPESSSPFEYCAKVSGAALINVIHFAIWFFPKIAAAADMRSWSLSPAKLS